MSIRNMSGSRKVNTTAVEVVPTVEELQTAYNRANATVTRLLLELQAAEGELRGAAVRLNRAHAKEESV